jgi:hypothetical protein
MADRHIELSQKVVDAFKGTLSDAAREQIGDARFAQLSRMISEALSEELETAVVAVEAVVKQLRAEVDKPELGL